MHTEVAFNHRLSLESAVERSQGYLLKEQKPEGYWIGELMVDSTLVSDTIAYHHWNGKVDPVWQRKAINHIFSLQLPDGGWNIYFGGPSEINASVKGYFALKLQNCSIILRVYSGTCRYCPVQCLPERPRHVVNR